MSDAYAAKVQTSVDAAGGSTSPTGIALSKAAGIPTAIWIDEIAALAKMRAALKQAQTQQRATDVETLCVFVVYNLPGRDCSAAASAGELRTGELDRYDHEFLSAIASLADEFTEVPKVFLLEPDSLPNVVTNMNRPSCASASPEYKSGIALAIRRLGPLGALYIDAGWSGWIGTWSAPRMAQVINDVLDLAGDAAHYVRGFVTNVSNYGSLQAEVTYANTLRTSLATVGRNNLAFIVDTGRNAGSQMGGTWCNPKGAGMGRPPTAQPGIPFADALFWIKPPGESDGISTPGSPRFDPKCAQQGASWTGAPEAGEWFDASFVELVQKAQPPLADAPVYTRHFVPKPNPPPMTPSPPSSPPPMPPRPHPSPPLTSEQYFEQQETEEPVPWQQEEEGKWFSASSSDSIGEQDTLLKEDHALAYGLARPASTLSHSLLRPPPPSPSPPPPYSSSYAASPPAPTSPKSVSSNAVTLAACVAILALLSLARGRPSTPQQLRGAVDEMSPANRSRRPQLPDHILRQARAARYAQLAGQESDEESPGDQPPARKSGPAPELDDFRTEQTPSEEITRPTEEEILRQARIAVELIRETQQEQSKERQKREQQKEHVRSREQEQTLVPTPAGVNTGVAVAELMESWASEEASGALFVSGARGRNPREIEDWE